MKFDELYNQLMDESWTEWERGSDKERRIANQRAAKWIAPVMDPTLKVAGKAIDWTDPAYIAKAAGASPGVVRAAQAGTWIRDLAVPAVGAANLAKRGVRKLPALAKKLKDPAVAGYTGMSAAAVKGVTSSPKSKQPGVKGPSAPESQPYIKGKNRRGQITFKPNPNYWPTRKEYEASLHGRKVGEKPKPKPSIPGGSVRDW
jgi:hypothetical protein